MASAAASRSAKAQAGPQCTSQTYCAPQGGLKDRCAESVESATFALTAGSGAAERRGHVLVHNNPPFCALLQHHGPASIEERARALFADEINGQRERCPSERPAAVHGEIIVEFGADASVGIEQIFLSAFAVFLPVVVFKRDDIEIREISVRCVVGSDFGDVHGAPRGDDVGNERSQGGLFAVGGRRGQRKNYSGKTKQ